MRWLPEYGFITLRFRLNRTFPLDKIDWIIIIFVFSLKNDSNTSRLKYFGLKSPQSCICSIIEIVDVQNPYENLVLTRVFIF